MRVAIAEISEVGVVACVALEVVVSTASGQRVIPIASMDSVIAAAAEQCVVTVPAPQPISASTTENNVIILAAHEVVVAAIAKNKIIDATMVTAYVDAVVSIATLDDDFLVEPDKVRSCQQTTLDISDCDPARPHRFEANSVVGAMAPKVIEKPSPMPSKAIDLSFHCNSTNLLLMAELQAVAVFVSTKQARSAKFIDLSAGTNRFFITDR